MVKRCNKTPQICLLILRFVYFMNFILNGVEKVLMNIIFRTETHTYVIGSFQINWDSFWKGVGVGGGRG